jgi:hypothetical protein
MRFAVGTREAPIGVYIEGGRRKERSRCVKRSCTAVCGDEALRLVRGRRGRGGGCGYARVGIESSVKKHEGSEAQEERNTHISYVPDILLPWVHLLI